MGGHILAEERHPVRGSEAPQLKSVVQVFVGQLPVFGVIVTRCLFQCLLGSLVSFVHNSLRT